MENIIQDTLAEILKNLHVVFRKFKVIKDAQPKLGANRLAEPPLGLVEKGPEEENTIYRIDIDTDEAAVLIGYHGETIYALQHLLKSLVWKKTGKNVLIVVDVDGYRKRQEENVITIAMKKVEAARKTLEDQVLPPMSPYFRRVVHMALTKPGFADIETESTGEGDHRAVVIKVKDKE